MEAGGLAPAGRASPEALARRLSFALTGLPPLPGDAALPFEALVDRLLGSPQFGERWARHWMDVVRYAETFGSEHDYWSPGAWLYRDYLVRAFNDDLPYEQFVIEQLAGDQLPRPRIGRGINESLLATAFHRMTEFYAAPVDVMREQGSVIDWQIESVTKAFLGLTVACARCHDHKFDAISTADYHALYGLFRGGRPVLNVIDDPAALTVHDAELLRLKKRIRGEIADQWAASSIASEALKKALESAAKDSLLAQLRDQPAAVSAAANANEEPKSPPLDRWHHSGPGLPAAPSPAGGFSLHPKGDAVVRAVLPACYASDAVSDRHGGSLRSPEFTLTKRNVSALAGGTGKARLRLVVEGCQGDIVLFAPSNPNLEKPGLRWITMRIRDQWFGRRARVEVMTRDDLPTVGTIKDPGKSLASDGRSSFSIARILQHDDGARLPGPSLSARLHREKSEPWDAYVRRVQSAMKSAIAAWKRDQLSDPQAWLLQALIEAGLLPNTASPGSKLATALADHRELESRIPIAKRAPGLRDDGPGADSPIFIRGDYQTPGKLVPRRMLEALGGRPLASSAGDRLALAREIASPRNPLTARVMVNRVWHQLFGRGLAASVDNLGRMGGRPSHPELLDHLATEFVRDGWSVKRLIRRIVTSAAWQTASEPSAEAAARDPDNLLLSRSPSRKLEAEAIRDSLLAVAGNLNLAQGGPSIFNHYREVTDPDKQPPPGPLDGRGRRSLYLEVRRNFLSDFLTTFDFPRPNLPAGCRNVTNVPAQSIAMLNDPFVHHQAAVWAGRIAREGASDEARIRLMHQQAFGRPAGEGELRRAFAFVRGSQQGWTELAHAMFNMKEFIYLP